MVQDRAPEVPPPFLIALEQVYGGPLRPLTTLLAAAAPPHLLG